MQRFRSIAIVILAVYATLIVVLNFTTAEMHFVLFSIRAPLAVLLAVTLLLGFVLGLLAGWRKGGVKR